MKRVDSDRHAVAIIGYLPDLEPLVPHRPLDSPGVVPWWSPLRGRLLQGASGQQGQAASLSPEDSSCADSVWTRLKGFDWDFLPEGSLQGSVFNLCSATLGAGVLSLPFAFSRIGWAFGLALLLVGAIATCFSIRLLMQAREVTGFRSYEELTVQVFGRKTGLIVELNIFVFCFGTAVAYIIAVRDIVKPVLHVLDVSQEHLLTVVIGFFGAIMFPLSLLEKINSLRFTSFLGVVSIFYLVFATVLRAANGPSASWQEAEAMIVDPVQLVRAAPIVMFAFTCQVNVFSIYDELSSPSFRRMAFVTDGAIDICFLVYALMGVFGYLHYGHATEGNILTNLVPCPTDATSCDAVVVVAFLAMAFTIVMAFPLLIFPCRYTLEVMLFKHKAKSSTRRVLLTCGICFTSLAIALFAGSIQTVFQLMGGTTSAFVCFVLPAAFAIKLDKEGRMEVSWTQRIAHWGLAIGGAAVGALSTGVTVLDLIAAP